MEKFIKIKRPFKVYDARLIEINNLPYAEVMVTDGKATSIIAVCTRVATGQLHDILASIPTPHKEESSMQSELVHTIESHKSIDLHKYNIVAWLTVNQRGHTITYMRKES